MGSVERAPLLLAALALAGCEWLGGIDVKGHPSAASGGASCPNGDGGCAGDCARSLFRGPGTSTPCASKPDGTLYCWGDNNYAEAGIGVASGSLLQPTRAQALPDPVRYTAGTGYATCALLASGAVYCVGAGGQVGSGLVGGATPCYDPAGCVGAPFPAIPCGVAELVGAGDWTGGSHFCARTYGGKVLCWADYEVCGAFVGSLVPKVIDGIEDAAELTAGGDFTCARRGDGTLWCWGENCNGIMGQGDTESHPGVVQVPLAGVTAIGSGTHHVCAVASGDLYCWGDNSVAQLGTGNPADKVPKPEKVSGLHDVVQVAGTVDATCALTAAGVVYCWGRGDYGAMGDGTLYHQQCPNKGFGCNLSPTKATIDDVHEIAAGYETFIARRGNGEIDGWGAGAAGQLGNGAVASSAFPVRALEFP